MNALIDLSRKRMMIRSEDGYVISFARRINGGETLPTETRISREKR